MKKKKSEIKTLSDKRTLGAVIWFYKKPKKREFFEEKQKDIVWATWALGKNEELEMVSIWINANYLFCHFPSIFFFFNK